MPPFLKFLIRRLAAMFASLIIITMILYAGVMIMPPEARARLYLPPGKGGENASENVIKGYIRQYHLDAPYPVQYFYWIRSLFDGSWGYSPVLREDVLPALLRRTPATLELAFYSLLLFIPFGIASGLNAGWRPGKSFDSIFRSLAFLGTSTPTFIFSIVLISIFYVQLQWFSPGRLDIPTGIEISKGNFSNFTGWLTIDSLLNGRFDIFVIALRHLAMPVLTLSMYHWATLGRITRATVMTERGKEYLTAARAHGVKEQNLIWRHALRVILASSLTAIALSAASIMTGVFVVEIIFGITGVSQIIVRAMAGAPDAPATLGFAVYSIILVIGLMFILDILQAVLDPRVREEILKT